MRHLHGQNQTPAPQDYPLNPGGRQGERLDCTLWFHSARPPNPEAAALQGTCNTNNRDRTATQPRFLKTSYKATTKTRNKRSKQTIRKKEPQTVNEHTKGCWTT